MFQNFSEAKENKERCSKLSRNKEEQTNDIPKLFRSKEEQTKVFQSFSGAKRNKPNYSNTFQDQSGTKPIVPKISRSNWNKPKYSKRDQSGTKRTLHKLDPNGIPDLECDHKSNLHTWREHRHGVMSNLQGL